MINNYFHWDNMCGFEQGTDDSFADDLRDVERSQIQPGLPLAIEWYHESNLNSKTKQVMVPPMAVTFFGKPSFRRNKICATQSWADFQPSISTIDEFITWFRTTKYFEHGRQLQHTNGIFHSIDDIQVVRFFYMNCGQ